MVRYLKKSFSYKRYIRLFPIFFIILIFGIPVYASDIYRYIDKEGVMHFTNVPTSSHYKLYIKDNSKKRSYTNSSSTSLYWTDRYDHLISKASERYGVPFSLLKAIIKVESNFNPRAVSRAGASGLMQIMPENFDFLDIDDPFDPHENIMGGTRYFRSLLDRFDKKVSLALAGYNAGPHRVVRYKGIPPYKETRNYVRKVKECYRILREKK